jgi:hypothetical protein
MPFLGDVKSKRDKSNLNEVAIMYSFLHTNNSRKLTNNDLATQKNDTVTSRHDMEFYEDISQQFQDMNFTLFSTLRAIGATTSSSENMSMSTENYKDLRFSKGTGNISQTISKVRILRYHFN